MTTATEIAGKLLTLASENATPTVDFYLTVVRASAVDFRDAARILQRSGMRFEAKVRIEDRKGDSDVQPTYTIFLNTEKGSYLIADRASQDWVRERDLLGI